MFVSYSFPVKKFLVQGENSIEVKFTSAVSFSKFKFDEYKETYGYPILPECPPPVQHGECHVNMIRKEPCSFSWVSSKTFFSL